jgi:hypothetical protein
MIDLSRTFPIDSCRHKSSRLEPPEYHHTQPVEPSPLPAAASGSSSDFGRVVIGKNAHDTRLVATIAIHEITHILTFNRSNCQRYREIIVISPESVLHSTN